jgi:hypothetical protein
MKICLDLHDFSVVNNRLDLLLKLKEYFPGFKVSLFTVPIDTEASWGPYRIRKDLLREIKNHMDWMQIIPHGLTHNENFETYDYLTFKNEIMPLIEKAFNRDGLPFEKGFCTPSWRWSEGVVRALNEAGWWGAVNRSLPKTSFTKRFYKFSHHLYEPFYDSGSNILKLHGHIYGSSNDLGKCLPYLLRLPKTVEWHYVTDFLEEK